MKGEGGVRGVVAERIRLLLGFAEKEAKRNPERSKRYVSLARRLAMRFRLRMPKEFKARFCKKCNAYWIPGFNVKVRLKPSEKRAVYECECGARRAFPYRLARKRKE
jgi:ribonuclease P protein subunit RPR2